MLDGWSQPTRPRSPKRCEAHGYLPDEGLATAAHLALQMHRPLFLEGDAGVGKTSLAQALAEVLGAELVRLQCYEGIDVSQALYDWDFPRQILHLRAIESGDRSRFGRGSSDRSTTGAFSSPGRSCGRSSTARPSC